MRAIQRAIAGSVIVPVVALGWGLAPAHAHRGDSDHDAPVVAHRHLEPHHVAPAHDVDVEVPHDDADDVVWLDDATIAQTSYQLSAPLAVRVVLLEPEPSRPCWFPLARDEAAPAHGPPRATLAFRGPPPTCLI